MERKYMMYEGEDTNTIDLLYESETTEGNGVKVIIPVKYQDQYNFRKKIKEQLCYFEDVYFDVPSDSSIHNDFTIARHPDFQFSELCDINKLHICLDNVYYPLDFEKLGIETLYFPVALRFNLSDGLFPTPNRESIRYTQEAKTIIKNKLSLLANYFVSKYNDNINSGEDIFSMINYLEKSGINVDFNGKLHNIESLTEFATIKLDSPKLEGISLIDFPSFYKSKKIYMLGELSLKHLLRNKRFSDANKNYVWGWTINNVCSDNGEVYIYEDKIPGIKKDYLRSICDEYKYVFLAKIGKPMELGIPAKFDINTYYHLLGLKNYDKSKWRDVIKEYQTILDMLYSSFKNLDELEVPQDFIDSRKKQKLVISSTGAVSTGRRIKLEGEITGKRAEDLLKFNSGRNCKFVPTIYKLEDIEKSKNLKVYAHHDDFLKIDALYGIIGKQKIELITFSQRELNLLKDVKMHNLITLEEFMEGNTSPFKRMVTAYYIKNIKETFRNVFERRVQIGYVCTDLQLKLEKIDKYFSINYSRIICAGGESNSQELLNEMLLIAEENNLFDMNIYPEAVELNDILTKLAFLNPLCNRMLYHNEEDGMVGVMIDLFKYYKYKINLKHYNLIEETVELLEEEIV